MVEKRSAEIACVHCKTLVYFSTYTIPDDDSPEYVHLQPGALFASVQKAETPDVTAYSIACSLQCAQAALLTPPVRH
jgi:hypothetical protein